MFRTKTSFSIALMNALLAVILGDVDDQAVCGETPSVQGGLSVGLGSMEGRSPSATQSTKPALRAIPTFEFQFDRAIATKKARAYLAKEFGSDDPEKYWKLESPKFAAIRITEEEARNNCRAAGRYVIVQFEDVNPPASAIFIVLGVSSSWVWREEVWLSGQMSMSEAIRDLHTDGTCC